MMRKKLRMRMIGGGEGAFIRAVHRMVSQTVGQVELVCGSFNSDPENKKRIGKK